MNEHERVDFLGEVFSHPGWSVIENEILNLQQELIQSTMNNAVAGDIDSIKFSAGKCTGVGDVMRVVNKLKGDAAP
jgi:hypothetical protein